MRFLLSTMVIIVAVAACFETGQTEEEKFDQRVYFKSSARDRIFVYQAKIMVTAEEARKFAQMRMDMSGRMTSVYIYQPNKIAPGTLNTENSIFRVNDFLYNATDLDAWRFAYAKTETIL